MSPEQCTSSKVDHRSDIYSLGVVLYEALTGEVPFLSDELVKVMAMHLSDPPKPLNQVREDLQFSVALEEVVYKSLAKNPDQRYQNMEEFAEALEESLKEPVEVRQEPKRPELKFSQDDSMEVARKTTEQAPAVKTDFASHALEALRSSGAYEDEHGNPIDGRVASTVAGRAYNPDRMDGASASATTNSATASRSNFQRGRDEPTVVEKVQNVVQKILVAALVIIVLGGIIAFAANNYPPIAQYLPWKTATNEEVDALVKQDKLEEALSILQDMKERTKLNKSQSETFGKVCVGLAKKNAGEKNYDDAIALLQQVPRGTASSKESRDLLKKYRNILDKEQP